MGELTNGLDSEAYRLRASRRIVPLINWSRAVIYGEYVTLAVIAWDNHSRVDQILTRSGDKNRTVVASLADMETLTDKGQEGSPAAAAADHQLYYQHLYNNSRSLQAGLVISEFYRSRGA